MLKSSMENEKIRFGIGNGSLLKPAAECFSEIGVGVDTATRRSWQDVNHELVGRVFVSRPQHVITYLERERIHCALVGQDMLAEYGGYGLDRCGTDWRIFFSFPFSKSSWQTNARVVLFARTLPRAYGRTKLKYGQFSVLSEYPRVTREFMLANRKKSSLLVVATDERRRVIIPSTGGTEGPVGDGMYDFGVGITDSGRTLADNNVRPIAKIMEAPVVLVTTGAILQKHRGLDRKIIELGKLFGGALAEKRREK